MASSYIPSLDGIRAISIALVFFAHVGFGHIIPGGFGVTVFFFLSGYLITTLLCREWDTYGSVSLMAFYQRRIVRLAPPIVITLLVCVLLVWFGVVQGQIDLGTISSQLFFYNNYYYLYADNPGNVRGLGVLWSLSVEEHFYLIWPALFILIAKQKIGIRGVILLTALILVWRIIRFKVLGSNWEEIYLSTDTRFDSLLYGCLLALMTWKGQADRIFPSLGKGYLVIAGALVVLAATVLIRDETFRATLRYSLQGLALMPLFYYAITYPQAYIFRILNVAPIRKIGHWSYTIYLIHFVIIRGFADNEVFDYGSPWLILTSGALSIAFAAAVYAVAEKPLQPLRKRLVGHAHA